MGFLYDLWQWKTIFSCAFWGVLYRLRKWLGWSICDTKAILSIYDALDPLTITYSQVWEDVRTLRRALCLKEVDRIITVSSGGDNALALLLDNPRHVLAVDFALGQVAMGELKKQAIKHLSYGTFLYFMGVGSAESCDLSRLDIYEKFIHEKLPPNVAEFWDCRHSVFEDGLIHAGGYEHYFRTFAKSVRPVALSLDAVEGLFGAGESNQKEFYDNKMNTWLWRFLCKLYFGDVLVGRCPAFYERSNVNVGDHFLERIRHVMREIDVSDNFYLEYILTGELSGRHGLPEYMQPQNFTLLKDRMDNINFIQGDILNVLEKSDVQFDAIDLSNLFDFVPLCTHDRYREAAAKAAAPGGKIVHWTFVPVSESRIDWKPFGLRCEVNKEMSKELNNQERAWFYQTFIVQNVEEGETSKTPYKNGYASHSNGIIHRNGFVGK